MLRDRLRWLSLSLGALGLGGLVLTGPAGAQSEPAADVGAQPRAVAPGNDYGAPDAWLCRPGRADDACSVDLTTTVVRADGTLEREPFTALGNPPIDCFYVYPTVSVDPTPNSDMRADAEERRVILAQFARFASRCRVYAPLYRQVTLTALRSAIRGEGGASPDRALALRDVTDAWRHYMENDNEGRGFVLVGHSQGSGVLTELIRREIDGKPVQRQLVSALLLGTSLPVPEGADVGGAFQAIPLCRSATQTGCAVAYAAFNADSPPPENTRFGRVGGEDLSAACVNPAALGGGSGELHAYFPTALRNPPPANPVQWVAGAEIQTPFVSVPGLLRAECVSDERVSYLSVSVNADPDDPRTDRIGGEVERDGQVLTDWGLHLIDVQVAMGSLLDLVEEQSRAYRAEK